jgi:DNA (cytosine-5)-methyltransferase 1
MKTYTVGSVCSGIEAASVAWSDLGFKFHWFSEIADFPSKVLRHKYPQVPNVGNMCDIPEKLATKRLEAPDLICGGTPCQAFSLAGRKKGLEDERGNLTLKLVEIVNENDRIRNSSGEARSILFWENVEGVLSDRTNAFGSFIASLAGCAEEVKVNKWPQAGIFRGPDRNIAWRVLDAKYFGLPQQRRRLYVLAGGKDFYPENVLFELHTKRKKEPHTYPLVFEKNGHSIEVFRSYTDCLYAAYGTKWNGNAAAYNGSLFVLQNKRLRRLTPLECERLMGFPDGYTKLPKVLPTPRYQAIGNSWAVPVVKWIGERLASYDGDKYKIDDTQFSMLSKTLPSEKGSSFFDMSEGNIALDSSELINCSDVPENIVNGTLKDIIDTDASSNFYISPAGCYGIIRRKNERSLKILPRLEEVLIDISSQWSPDKIEKVSRVQKRGRFSDQQGGLFN